MKRKLILMGLCMSLLLSISLLCSCGTAGEEDIDSNLSKIQDYFPMDENANYVYEGLGNEYSSYEVFTEYASIDRVQQRLDNGGTVMVEVIQLKDGKLTKVFSRGEVYYRENFLDLNEGVEEVLLMEPLQKGTTWILEDGRERTIENIDVEISTPSGDYDALEVKTTGDDYSTSSYYAKDIGLVKTIFISEDTEISSSLKEVENNGTRTELMKFYFPSIEYGKIFIKNKEVTFETNDITSLVLEKAYKSAIVSDVGEVLTTNTKINRLFLNDANKVELDLSGFFLSEMNAGAEYESMILQSIANTFGQYYGADEVIITIDGKLYSSGHIEFKEGESIKVNYENTEEIEV